MCPPTAPAPKMQSLMPLEYPAMKICRFDDDRVGVVSGDTVRDVSLVLGTLPSYTHPFPPHDALIAHLEELKPDMQKAASSAPPMPLAQVKLLSPVANPGKIIAAPVNYRKHLEEALAD